MKQKTKVMATALATGILTFGFFQNCSKAKFSSNPAVPVTGTNDSSGIPPLPDILSIDINPNHLDFGQVALNTTATQDVTVTNPTSSEVDLSLTAVSGDYVVDASSCATLAAGASCVVHVSFKPDVVAPPPAVFTVTATEGGKTLPPTAIALTGTGFFIPPSSADKVALVGWYSYKQPNKITFAQTGANAACPAVTSAGGHGQAGEYCYEPSGAHGMYFGDTSVFPTLTSYILQNGAAFNSNVTTLDQLFSSPADHTSDNKCLVEGLFYYALSYLIVPIHQDVKDPAFDVRFAITNVDDGLQLITNGAIMGNVYFNQATNFSLHRTTAGSPVLTNGANTIAALWVDDCATQRNIVGAEVLYNGAPFVPLVPNVMRGYIYNKQNGTTYTGATVAVTDFAGVVHTAQTDVSGFFQLTGIADGAASAVVTVAGNVNTETVNFDYHSAATAVIDFSRGY